MLGIIETLNRWAAGWSTGMASILWQSTVLVILAAVVAWCLRRSSPVVRYWLWQIVAIKLLLMPFWTSYVPLPTWASSRPAEQTATVPPIAGPVDESRQPLTTRPPWWPEAGRSEVALPAPSLWAPLEAITWQAWLLLAWTAIVLWQFGRVVGQHWKLARLLRQGTPADEDLAGLVVELAEQLGLRRVPTAVSVATHCPLFVCGVRQPRLVLPSRLMASLDRSARRQVILHELAHVKRRDLLWGWPVEIARIVYFFHPFVYWIAYRLRLERELACDQLAMARSGHPPAEYAQTLVQVVSHASAPETNPRPAVAPGGTNNEETR